MPASYAHYRFGKQALKIMPPEARQCVQRFRRMYDAGLQGPDIFFYYNPCWKTATGGLGKTFHRKTGGEFFPAACKAASSEAARAYLYGLLAHYCLDAGCHGFIRQLESAGEANHVVFEAEFERFLLVLDGQSQPESYDISSKIRLTRGECMSVAEFYPGTTGGQISHSVKSMALGLRFLAKPGREKLLRKLGLSFADFVIPAEDNEEHTLYLGELKALYDDALGQYPRMLENLLAHMEHGHDLGPDFEKTFG